MSGLNIKELKRLQPYLDKRAFEENLESYLSTAAFLEEFLEFEKSRKQVSQSSRVLNNWAKLGIINPPDKGKKRKLNKIDSIWLDLVSLLREFGLSLDKIKSIKEELFSPSLAESSFIALKYALIHSIVIEPYILMVFFNGTIKLLKKSEFQSVFSSDSNLAPHINLNLLEIAMIEFPNNNFESLENNARISELSEKEMELLYFIRTGDFEEIKVRLEDNEIYLIESTSKLSPNMRIIDLINEVKYQDIEIKIREGKTSLIKRTELLK